MTAIFVALLACGKTEAAPPAPAETSAPAPTDTGFDAPTVPDPLETGDTDATEETGHWV